MTAPNTIASDTLVEAVALSLLNDDRTAGGWPAVETRDGIPDSHVYVRNAQAALTAIADAGYAVVPREPTEAMCEAGWRQMPDSIADAYREMVAAATVTHCNHANNGKAE